MVMSAAQAQASLEVNSSNMMNIQQQLACFMAHDAPEKTVMSSGVQPQLVEE